ncbi:hypothetical protein ESZ50_07955 [Weissella muntiaci]|uniref:Uncharacterized protein n=1 Tax=Weissella muntiaci TaxID=2508881 RepID=A0A6C2C534_9LACO|nr:hypothetical protein [Weissella muntiaci]TYC48802.1 hypothetical protein ESZ50_07955 [Weissella muntiaci]
MIEKNENFIAKMDLKIQGNRSGNDYYSNWEINRISNSLNNLYYKNELLAELDKQFESEISKSNILCLDGSLQYSNSYKKLNDGVLDMRISKDINTFYYLGVPISFGKNKKFDLIQLGFSIYREYFVVFNSKTHSIDVNHPDTKNIVPKIYNFIETSLKNTTSKPSSELLQLINEDVDYVNDLKNKKVKYVAEFENIRNTVLKNISQYLIEFDNVYFERNLSQRKVLKRGFLNKFNTIDRPIVAVIQDDNRIKILGTNMFIRNKFSKKNPQFFETKQISQNSPLIFIVGVSICLGGGIIRTMKKINKNKAADLENFKIKEADNLKNKDIKEQIEKAEEEIAELDEQMNEIAKQITGGDDRNKKTADEEISVISKDSNPELKSIQEDIDLGIRSLILEDMVVKDIKRRRI